MRVEEEGAAIVKEVLKSLKSLAANGGGKDGQDGAFVRDSNGSGENDMLWQPFNC